MLCIKNIWLLFGLQMKLILLKIYEIGRNLMQIKNILLSMFLLFLLLVMGS